jgi:hypothetical protein
VSPRSAIVTAWESCRPPWTCADLAECALDEVASFQHSGLDPYRPVTSSVSATGGSADTLTSCLIGHKVVIPGQPSGCDPRSTCVQRAGWPGGEIPPGHPAASNVVQRCC